MTSFKHARPLRWLLMAFVAGSLLTACNNSKTKTDENKMDSLSSPQAMPVTPVDTPAKKVDSLPPLDRKAKGKPENGNT
jgi:hypothetical protein